MVSEKEEKVVDRAEDSLSSDKKPAVVSSKDEASNESGKPFIQMLNISSDATTVKADTTPFWLKALKVILAFIVLWGLDAAIYAAVLELTIETGDGILYAYFGIFMVLASLLAFAVLYGMRIRDLEAEIEARKLRQESGIVESLRSVGGGARAPRGAVAVNMRADSFQPAKRASSKVQFAAE